MIDAYYVMGVYGLYRLSKNWAENTNI